MRYYECAKCRLLSGLADDAVLDTGMTLTCSQCGGDTVVLLLPPGHYAPACKAVNETIAQELRRFAKGLRRATTGLREVGK